MSRVAMRERRASAGSFGTPEVVVLAVGDVLSIKRSAGANVAGEATAFADYTEVTGDLLEALDPEIVVSSVLGRNFDCVDLAEKLDHLGYSGCYRLIGHGIPQPELVLREIRSLFPALRVELEPAIR